MKKLTTKNGKLKLEIEVSDISINVLKSTYKGKTCYHLRDDINFPLRKAYNHTTDFARKVQEYIPDEQSTIIKSELQI